MPDDSASAFSVKPQFKKEFVTRDYLGLQILFVARLKAQFLI